MIERHREIRRRRTRNQKRRKLRERLKKASEPERGALEARLLKTYPSWIPPEQVLPRREKP